MYDLVLRLKWIELSKSPWRSFSLLMMDSQSCEDFILKASFQNNFYYFDKVGGYWIEKQNIMMLMIWKPSHCVAGVPIPLGTGNVHECRLLRGYCLSAIVRGKLKAMLSKAISNAEIRTHARGIRSLLAQLQNVNRQIVSARHFCWELFLPHSNSLTCD